MKNSLIGFIIGILLGGIGMYFLRDCETEIIKVPVIIEAPVPAIIDSFPPILNPKPIKTPVSKSINKSLKGSLDKVTSERDSLRIYKAFATKRVYREVFEDTIQTITVNMEATGTVDKVNVLYEQKPRSIRLDTIINIPVKKQSEFWIKANIVTPYKESNISAAVAPELIYVNTNNTKMYGVEVDPMNQTLKFGIGFKF